MKFVLKLSVILLALSLISFLPEKVAAVAGSIILFSATAILLVAILAVFQEFNPLNISGIRKNKSGKKLNSGKFRHVSYNGINVCYTMRLNGGGLGLSYEFVRLVSKHIGKIRHVHEFCAGPGFIGFNLLANNLCEKLTLSDINPDAIEAIRETIKINGLEDRVTAYQSDCLDSVPTDEKWDLIVSNPPWDIKTDAGKNLILSDPGAGLHKRFLRDAPKFLNPDGSVLFVESHEYTRKRDFAKLLEGTGFTLSQYFPAAPLLRTLNGLDEYKNVSRSMSVTLRFALLLLGIYFVRLEPVSTGS